MDQEFLLSLPDDAEEAFPIYEQRARLKHTEYDRQHPMLDRVGFLNDMIAFSQVHDIDLGIDLDMLVRNRDSEEFYSRALNKIQISSTKYSLQTVLKKKKQIVPSYIMTPVIKAEIHHYISLIRDVLEKVSIPIDKKEVLYRRLDAFAAEVNKDRTKLEALGSGYVYVMKKIGEGVEELKPAAELFQKIFGVVGKSEEESLILPKAEDKKLLEDRTKSLSVADMEDEIPF